MKPIALKIEGPKRAKTCVVLTHGTNESSDAKFLTYFAEGLAASGRKVVRFDFPYMTGRSTTGKKRPPDKEEVLIETWHQVLSQLQFDKIVIGGRTMGGRVATRVADAAGVSGVLCLGYPFHPSGRPEDEEAEVAALQTLKTPTLIIQGEYDPFGSREEIAAYSLPESIQFHWVPDGDQGYNVIRGSLREHSQNLKNALRSAESFLFSCWGM